MLLLVEFCGVKGVREGEVQITMWTPRENYRETGACQCWVLIKDYSDKISHWMGKPSTLDICQEVKALCKVTRQEKNPFYFQN